MQRKMEPWSCKNHPGCEIEEGVGKRIEIVKGRGKGREIDWVGARREEEIG